ncbi:hypothetical protein PARA125_001792 [Parachlamydia sp. AcF125]|nr:hypothetical protein [Parachlamydia sp. AcF125]
MQEARNEPMNYKDLGSEFSKLEREISALEQTGNEKTHSSISNLSSSILSNQSTPSLQQIQQLKGRLKILSTQSHGMEQATVKKITTLFAQLKELKKAYLQANFFQASPPSTSIPIQSESVPPEEYLSSLTLSNVAHLVGDAILEKARTSQGKLIEGTSKGIEFMHLWLNYLKDTYELPQGMEIFFDHLDELKDFNQLMQEGLNKSQEPETIQEKNSELQPDTLMIRKDACEKMAKQVIQKLQEKGSVRFSWGWHASKPDKAGHAMLVEIQLDKNKTSYKLHVFNTGDGTQYHSAHNDGTKLYVNTLQGYSLPVEKLNEDFIFKMLEPLFVPFSRRVMDSNAEFDASHLYVLLSSFSKIEPTSLQWMKGQLSGTCRLRSLIAYFAFCTKDYKVVTNLWEREIARCLITVDPEKLQERDMRVLTDYLLSRLFHQQAKIIKFDPKNDKAIEVLKQLEGLREKFEILCEKNGWEIALAQRASVPTQFKSPPSVSMKIAKKLEEWRPPEISKQEIKLPFSSPELPAITLLPLPSQASPKEIIDSCHTAHQFALQYIQAKGNALPFLEKTFADLSFRILNSPKLQDELQVHDCSSLLNEILDLSALLFNESVKQTKSSEPNAFFNLKNFLAFHSALALGWQLCQIHEEKAGFLSGGVKGYSLALPPVFTLPLEQAMAQLPSPCLEGETEELFKHLHGYFVNIGKVPKEDRGKTLQLFNFATFGIKEQPSISGIDFPNNPYFLYQDSFEMLTLSKDEYEFTLRCFPSEMDWAKIDEQRPKDCSASAEDWRVYCYYTGHLIPEEEGFSPSFLQLRQLAWLAKCSFSISTLPGSKKRDTASSIKPYSEKDSHLGIPRSQKSSKNKLCFSIQLRELTQPYPNNLPEVPVRELAQQHPYNLPEKPVIPDSLTDLGTKKNLQQNELLAKTDSSLHELVSAQASKSAIRYTTLISYFNKHPEALMDPEKQAYFIQIFFEVGLFKEVIVPQVAELLVKFFENHLKHLESAFKDNPHKQEIGDTLAFICEQYERALCDCIEILDDKDQNTERLGLLQQRMISWNADNRFSSALAFRERLLLCFIDSFKVIPLTVEDQEQIKLLIIAQVELEKIRENKPSDEFKHDLNGYNRNALKQSAQAAFLQHLPIIQAFLKTNFSNVLSQITASHMSEADIEWQPAAFPFFTGQDKGNNRYQLDIITGEFKKNDYPLSSCPSNYKKHPFYQEVCSQNPFIFRKGGLDYYEGVSGENKIRLYGDADNLLQLHRKFDRMGWYSLQPAEQGADFLPAALKGHPDLQIWIKANNLTESAALIIFNKQTKQVQYTIDHEGIFTINGERYECLEADTMLRESLQGFDSHMILWESKTNKQYVLSFPYITSPANKNQPLHFKLDGNRWKWESSHFFLAENQRIGGLAGFEGFLIIENPARQCRALIPQKTQQEFDTQVDSPPQVDSPRHVSYLTCQLTSPPRSAALQAADWTPQLAIQTSPEANTYLTYLHFMHARTPEEYKKALSLLKQAYSYQRFTSNQLRILGWIFCHTQEDDTPRFDNLRRDTPNKWGINHSHYSLALQLYVAALVRQNLQAHPSKQSLEMAKKNNDPFFKPSIPTDLAPEQKWEEFWQFLSLASWSTDTTESKPIPQFLQKMVKEYLKRMGSLPKDLRIESLVPTYLLSTWGMKNAMESEWITPTASPTRQVLQDLEKISDDLNKVRWKELRKNIKSQTKDELPPFRSRQGKDFIRYFPFLFQQANSDSLEERKEVKDFLDEAYSDTYPGNKTLRLVLRIACELKEREPQAINFLLSSDKFPENAQKVVDQVSTLLFEEKGEIDVSALNQAIQLCVDPIKNKLTTTSGGKANASTKKRTGRTGQPSGNRSSRTRTSHSTSQPTSTPTNNTFAFGTPFQPTSTPSNKPFAFGTPFQPTSTPSNKPFAFGTPSQPTSTPTNNPFAFGTPSSTPSDKPFAFKPSTQDSQDVVHDNPFAIAAKETSEAKPSTRLKPPRQILPAINTLELPSAYPGRGVKGKDLKKNLFADIKECHVRLFPHALSSKEDASLGDLSKEIEIIKEAVKKEITKILSDLKEDSTKDSSELDRMDLESDPQYKKLISLADQFKLHTLLGELRKINPSKFRAFPSPLMDKIRDLNELAKKANIEPFKMPAQNLNSDDESVANFINSSIEDLTLDYYLGAIKNRQLGQTSIKISEWEKVEEQFEEISQQLMKEHGEASSTMHNLEQSILKLANQQLKENPTQAAKVGAKHRAPLTLEDCVLLFLHGDAEMYRKKMGFSRSEIEGKQQAEKLHSMIGEYLEAFVRSHHLESICQGIQRVNEAKSQANNEELLQAIGNLNALMSTSHDLSKCPVPHIFLVFEYCMTKLKDDQLFLVRQHSIEGLNHALQTETNHQWRDIFIQLIQAGGKTLVWGQMLALAKADGYHLSVHVSPDHQYATSVYNMGEKALAIFTQEQRLFEFDDRPEYMTKEHLTHLKDTLILAIHKRQFIHTTSESLQALRCRFLKEALRFKENDKAQRDRITLMSEILSIFRGRGVFTFDEVHQAMDPLKELNMPFGKIVHPDIQEGELIGKLLRLLISEGIVKQGSLKDCIDQLNQQTHHEADSKKMMENLPGLLLKDPLWRGKLGIQHPHEEQELIEFLSNPHKPLPDFLEKNTNSLTGGLTAAEYAVLAQRLIGDGWLMEGLQKKVDEHHGLIAVGGHPLISIPFQANMKPLIGSEFSDHYVMMIHTLIAYLSKGIFEEQVDDFVGFLRAQAQSEMQRKVTSDLETTAAYQVLRNLREKEPLLTNFFEQEKVDAKSFCQALRNTTDDTVLQMLISYISIRILHKVDLYESQVSSNGKSTATMAKSINGYSGNLDNSDMRPTLDSKGRQVEWYPDSGTSGQTIDLLVNRNSALHVVKPTPQALLSLLHHEDYKGRFHAIIDVGCHFRGLSSLEVARLISEQVNKAQIKGILFYDPQGHLFCLHIQDQNCQPIQGTDKEHLIEQTGYKLGELFTYYDQDHITGADIPQDDHALALVTASEATPLYELCQGNRRMRKLEEGQGVVHALSESCVKCMVDRFKDSPLQKLSEKGIRDEATMQQFILFTYLNEMEARINDNLQHCLQDLINTTQQYVLDTLYDKKDSQLYMRLASHGAPLFARQVVTSLLKEYKEGKISHNIGDYLQKVSERLITMVSDIVLNEEIESLKTQLEQIRLAAIPRLASNIELSANFLNSSVTGSQNREGTMVQCQESQMNQENETEQLAINQTRMQQDSKIPKADRQKLNKKIFFSPDFGNPNVGAFTLLPASQFFPDSGLQAIVNFDCVMVTQNYLDTIVGEEFSLTSKKPITHLLCITDSLNEQDSPSFKLILGSQEDVDQFASYIRKDKEDATRLPSRMPPDRQMALLMLDGQIVEGDSPPSLFLKDSPLYSLLAVAMLIAADTFHLNQEKWLDLFLLQLKEKDPSISRSIKIFFETYILSPQEKEKYFSSDLNRRWCESLQ